jgi:predicted RND superfamily exporter protein
MTPRVTKLAERFARHPWWILALALVLSALAGWATVHLPVYTSRQALLPQNTDVARRLNGFLEKFGAASDLIVVLEGAPRPELESFATDLATRLRAEPEISQATERLDLRFFLEHVYLLVPPEKLDQIDSWLTQTPDRLPGLDESLNKALAWIKARPSLSTIDLRAAEESVEGLSLFLAEWQRWLAAERPPAGLDWKPLLARQGAEGMGDGWFASRDGRMLFLFVHPKNPSSAFEARKPFVEKVRTIAAELAGKARAAGHTPPTVGLTGLPAVEYEEYIDIEKDITLVIWTAAGLIGLLILVVVRSFRWALAIFVPMGLGALWSLGLAWLTVGHLTIVTSSFLAILFGLGADYGIFTSSRIAEERRAGRPLVEAIGLGIGSSFSAVLTAGGASLLIFGALATVDFPGFAELGRVAAGGVLLILVSTWMVQPALYALLPPRLAAASPLANSDAPALRHEVKATATDCGAYPRPVAALLVVLAVGAALAGGAKGLSIPFDYDVLSLLPKDSEAAHYQRRMVAESDYQAEVVIFTAKNMAEARRITDEAGKLGSIARVQSLANLFPADADNRLQKARTLGEEVARRDYAGQLAGLERAGLSEKSFGVLNTLLAQGLDLIDDSEEQAFSAGHANLVKGLEKVRGQIEALQAQIGRDAGRARERTELFYRALLNAGRTGLEVAEGWQKADPLTPEKLPTTLRDRFFAADGTTAIYAFPRESVYDPASLDRLVREVYSVSPEATGFPTTHQAFSKSVVESFTHGTTLAVAVCLIWLVLVLRSVRGFVLASLPLLIGGGWMLGLMALGGLRYNYANIIALPLVIALAVDYGVWYSHRWRELENRSPLQVTRIAGKVIALAAGTELAGLGAITLARYRGVSTLGVDITLGLLCCLAATLLIAPAIGQILDSRRRT